MKKVDWRKLYKESKDSSFIRAEITLFFAVFFAWIFYYNGQSIDHGQLFDLKLAITLALVEVPILMFSPILYRIILNESRAHAKEIGEEVGKQLGKVQNKDESQKEKHTKELNEKIFKRLATVSIREDKHRNYGLYVKKDDTQDDPRFASIIYAITDHTMIPLDKLPSVYYEWAVKHLEHNEYSDKILKPFNQLQEWIKQYVEKETAHREKLEKQIEAVIRKSFENCTIFEKTIRKRLEMEIFEENPDHRFDDLIIDKISRQDAIMPRGYPMEAPYMICESITGEQLEEFKKILTSIMNSVEFLSMNKEQNVLLYKKIDPLLKELGNKFQRLSMELGASGSIIQGKCKVCSTFS